MANELESPTSSELTSQGFFAWWLWRTDYLSKLPRFEKKIRVALDWTLDLRFAKDFACIRAESAISVSRATVNASGGPTNAVAVYTREIRREGFQRVILRYCPLPDLSFYRGRIKVSLFVTRSAINGRRSRDLRGSKRVMTVTHFL